MRNLITDLAGVRVGHTSTPELGSGVTAVLFDEPVAASVDVRGGAPGTHETDLLDPAMTVGHIDAISLSGGSAFGLEATAGIQAYLREQGRGFAIGSTTVPIVPGATLFDLSASGIGWTRFSPYRDLGYAAAASALPDCALGSTGAGLGATTVNLKGGIGSASARSQGGHLVAALVAVNSVGAHGRERALVLGRRLRTMWRVWGPRLARAHAGRCPHHPDERQRRAEHDHRVGGDRCPAEQSAAPAPRGDGSGWPFARALSNSYLAGRRCRLCGVNRPGAPIDPFVTLSELGTIAANVMARAVARGVFGGPPAPSPAGELARALRVAAASPGLASPD